MYITGRTGSAILAAARGQGIKILRTKQNNWPLLRILALNSYNQMIQNEVYHPFLPGGAKNPIQRPVNQISAFCSI